MVRGRFVSCLMVCHRAETLLLHFSESNLLSFRPGPLRKKRPLLSYSSW